MKTVNVGNFRRPAKIFAGVAKFHNPCKKKLRKGCEISHSLASEFDTKLQSAITFSSKLRLMRSWILRKAL